MSEIKKFVYIVSGSIHERYGNTHAWFIAVYEEEAQAKLHVELLDAAWSQAEKPVDQLWENPYDSRGTTTYESFPIYEYTATPIVKHVDQYLEFHCDRETTS